MKRFTSLLLIILLLFSFSACTTDDDEPIHVPPSNWYNASVCLSGYASDEGYWEYALNSDAAPAGMPIYKVGSAQELADFKETMQPYFSFSVKKQNTSSFNEITADCDDAFFAHNALLIIYIEAGSGTYRYRVASVEISAETLAVTIDQYNDKGEHTCDMSGWLAVIKVPKEKLNGVTSYNAQRADN